MLVAYRARAPKTVPWLGLLLIIVSSLVTPMPLSAAQVPPSEPDEAWQTRPWMGDVAFLSANALLAGLTAGILHELRDGTFQDGFARGALGGAVSYGGRRVAAADFAGAGFVGRQVSAVGASEARNAGDGRPAFSRFTLPIGPVALEIRTDGGPRVRPRVDLYGATWLFSAILDGRAAFDARESLSAGAPVFRTPGYRIGTGDEHSVAVHVGGNIILSDDVRRLHDVDVLAHERVHVLQYDFLQELWGESLESWAAARIPRGGDALRYVRLGFIGPLVRGSVIDLLELEWESRPWEIEAEFLESR